MAGVAPLILRLRDFNKIFATPLALKAYFKFFINLIKLFSLKIIVLDQPTQYINNLTANIIACYLDNCNTSRLKH